MARTLGRTALTLVGTGLGGPIGSMVGTLLGSLLLPQRLPHQYGPRLTDLAATSATEGAARHRGFGTIKMAGNCIWCPGLVEIATTEKYGGKGGPVQKVTTYAYYSNLAVAFGEGVAADVLQIYIDKKLVYDKTSGSDYIAKEGLRFRFYTGAEDQEPDPLIVSLEDEKDVGAYRGTCYIVFEQLPLEEYGNRPIPNIEALISWAEGETAPTVVNVDALSGGVSTVLSPHAHMRDWRREYAYEVNTSPLALRRINTRDMVEDRQALFADIMAGTSWPTNGPYYGGAVTPGGKLIMSIGTFNATPIVLIDPVTMSRLDIWGEQSIFSAFTPTRAPPITYWAGTMVTYTGMAVERNEYMLGKGFNDDGNVGLWRVDSAPTINAAPNTMGYVWDSQTAMGGLGIGEKILPIAKFDVSEQSSVFVCFGLDETSGATEIGVAEIEVFLSASHHPDTPWADGVSVTYPDAIEAFYVGVAEFRTLEAVWRDDTDESFILLVKPTNSTFQMFKVSAAFIVQWSVDVTATWGAAMAGPESVLKDNTLGWVRSTGIGARLDTRTGEYIDAEVNFGTSYSSGVYRGVWSSRSQSFSVLNAGAQIMRKYLFGRGTSVPESVGNIVRTLCGQAGLDAEDLDASDLDADMIPGFALTQGGMTARAGIDALRQLYFFDGVEIDDQLVFRKRSGLSSSRTIEAADLVASPAGEAWSQTDQQEVELPERVTVSYQSVGRQYEIATQSAKRMLKPIPAMYSRAQQTLEITAALEDVFARQSAENGLYQAWVGRSRFSYKLPWTHIDLDPGDVITVEPSETASFIVAVEEVQLGADLSLETAARAEETGQYVSTIAAAPGDGAPAQVIAAPVLLQLLLMDMPLLRNFDEVPGRSGAPVYYAMGAFHDGDRVRGNLYKSPGDDTWEGLGRVTDGAAWGGTAGALPDTATPMMTDNTSELTVWMQDGGDRLESITDLQMLNGGNPAALINTSGEIEIIQFRDVTENADGSYTLSGFLRGRRGTETFTGGHHVGEIFVLLDTVTVDRFLLTVAELNVARQYKAVPDGQLREEVTADGLSAQLRALMPYAPCQIAGALDGTDIDLTWVRRDRLGSDLVDGFDDQPLSEDAELYSIDIYSGSTIVETYSSSTPSYTYTAAQQTADGFTPPLASLKLAVYQVSGQVGRGFGEPITIEIEA